MSNSPELQDISNVVETVFVAFDMESEEFYDKTVEKLLELAIDKYHFRDSALSFSNVEQRDWFERMLETIDQDLSNIDEELLIKVLASIYRSVQRRTGGGREYLQFAKEYVGAWIGPGSKIINL